MRLVQLPTFCTCIHPHTAGPYLIACGAKSNIFWQVNKDEEHYVYSVGATTDPRAASCFYIIPNDDGVHPYEFRIGWTGDKHGHLKRTPSALRPDTPGHLEPLFRYLDARVSITGNNSGPLYLKSELYNTHSRLTLHNRVIGDNKAPTDTRVWSYGNEEFFINCARRKFKKDGFIAVKRISVRTSARRVEERYVTMCLPSEKYHDEQNVWMLFRLFPPEFSKTGATDPTDVEVRSLIEEKLDDEFEGLFGKVSRLPLLNLVFPQSRSASTSGKQEGGGGGGVATTAGGAERSRDKLDVGGATLDVSGSHMSSKGNGFKHEDIPLKELPKTTTIASTTPV